jgi:hypothetical protein
MKQTSRTRLNIAAILLGLLCAERGLAQGYDDPLTFQGLDHTTMQSAASRAAGGTTFGLQGTAGTMFLNPASLQSLKEVQFSIGAIQQYTNASQLQQYAPLKYYSNFSLLMEGLTGYIPNPDTSYAGANAGDTVQRPFDTIGPNWSRTAHKGLPLQLLLAVPFSLGGMRVTAGIGAVEYANLNHYYQNNNVLSPAIGSERPVPTPLPPNNPDSTMPARWYQYYRLRDGSIRGYGAAFSASLSDEVSVGVSGQILKGSTDDAEQHVGRGVLVFYSNYFRLDSLNYRNTRIGTSDFSGQEFSLSGIYRGKHLTLGFSVIPPSTITRKFNADVRVDTEGTTTTTHVSGEDKLSLPWRGTVGLSIMVRTNLMLGLEYEMRPYESSVYKRGDGTESNPWLSSNVLHVGAEFTPLPWLAVRAGMRGQAEVFEPDGNPIIGDPVSTTVYSAGCGFLYAGIRWNLAYEYARVKYQDAWQTNVNLNSESRHAIVADVAYELH